MQAAAAFNRAALTTRPLRRPPRSPLHLAGAGDGAAGRGGAPLTRLRCSASLSVGAGGYGGENVPVFTSNHAQDPYKLLGVDHDASEEVRSARNFLLQQYSGYEESEEAIEDAYDKIIMKSYSHRKKIKINLKSKLKKQVEESPSLIKALLGCFEVPSVEIILRRFAPFGFIAGWSIATSAETGPTFQLALSLSHAFTSSMTR